MRRSRDGPKGCLVLARVASIRRHGRQQRIMFELRSPNPATSDEFHKHRHIAMTLHGVPQGLVQLHAVNISSTFANVRQVASLFELGDYLLHGALGDPHPRREIANTRVRVTNDADQNVGVIRQKRPRSGRHARLGALLSSSYNRHVLTQSNIRTRIHVSICVSHCTYDFPFSPPQMWPGCEIKRACDEFER